MIRVLHSVSNMDRGGIETMLMNYYRHMDRNKVQFDFLCNKTKPGVYDEEIRALGGRIFHTPGLNPLKYPKYVRRMQRLVEDNGYQIVHVHNGAMGVYALNAAKYAGVPVRIFHAHGAKITMDKKWIIKMFCKMMLPYNMNHRFTCGMAAANCYFGKKSSQNGNVILVPNAIDIQRFLFDKQRRSKMRSENTLEDKHVIGHVGRFVYEKNHMFLLEVFAELRRRDPKAYLVLVGDGELMEQAMARASGLGIRDSVLFVGSVENVYEWYQAFDVFVMTSHREGLPVVGVEAQAADLPCVFSDSITREVGILQKTVFISLAAGVNAWADAIQQALTIRERKEVGALIAENGFDIQTEAAKLQKMYLEFSETEK